jgi:hypothetical protein
MAAVAYEELQTVLLKIAFGKQESSNSKLQKFHVTAPSQSRLGVIH